MASTTNIKAIPDYKMVGELRVSSSFSTKAVQATINLKPQPGDIFVATFPKCGTTWMQHIILLILNDAKPFNGPSDFLFKCPYLELTGVEALDSLTTPRCAKVHLPFNLTPYSPEAKYIYVARNPKDTMVSFFHHTRSNPIYYYANGQFEDYFEIFLNGEVDYGDFFKHVLSWYERRNNSNVLFMYYENMKTDVESAIVQVGTFLGPKYQALVEDPAKLADILHYSSFEYMKKNCKSNASSFQKMMQDVTIDLVALSLPPGIKHMIEYQRNKPNVYSDTFELVRKGIVGGWRANFTEDQNKRMDEKIERILEGTEMLRLWKSLGCV